MAEVGVLAYPEFLPAPVTVSRSVPELVIAPVSTSAPAPILPEGLAVAKANAG
jgi:hypothetical protein